MKNLLTLLLIVALATIVLLVIYALYLVFKRGFKDFKRKLIDHLRIYKDKSPSDRAGIWGERFTNKSLKCLLDDNEYLLSNLLLPLNNGHKTEIDCLIISKKGIFCIETKYWVGHIKGSDEDDVWIQEYDDPYKDNKEHRNPVKQNERHCDVLKRILKYKYDICGCVIFVGLDPTSDIKSNYVYTINDFEKWYKSLPDSSLSESEIEELFNTLSKFVATEDELKAHRDDLNNRFKDNS